MKPLSAIPSRGRAGEAQRLWRLAVGLVVAPDGGRRRALMRASAAALVLAGLIFAGSRGLRDFDGALAHYAMTALIALFALVYRGSIWMERPPTRILFRRALINLRRSGALAAPRAVAPIPARFVAQDFIRRRGRARWFAHMCLSGGSSLAFAITFPLVFGWVHFESIGGSGDVYRVHVFGLTAGSFPVHSAPAWLAFNALNLAAILVLTGVGLAGWRRLNDPGERATQTFAEDWLPLLILFAVAATGLGLTADARWMAGRAYRLWAATHAASVAVLLLHIPFGKLFHILQRSASWAAGVNQRAAATAPKAHCASCGDAFASAAQIEDLKSAAAMLGFNFVFDAPSGASRPLDFQDVCPACRRRAFAINQGRTLGR